MVGYPHSPTRDDANVIGARIGAQIVDTLVMTVIIAVFFYGFAAFGSLLNASGAFGGLGLLIGFVANLFYWLLLEGMWGGYTVGKRLFGIKVVEEDGHECSLGSSFARNLFEIIDGLFYYLVGLIVMAATDKRQRVGDRLGGTIVVRESPRNSPDSQSEEDSANLSSNV